MERWREAQELELRWHGDCVNTYHEETKQLEYARGMGLPVDEWDRIDLAGRTVTDLGSGPASLLLKAHGFRVAYAVDPLMDRFPEWVRLRYQARGITPITALGEALSLPPMEEVWVYNVLEHAADPEQVLTNALLHATKVVRVWEWIETQPDELHLNALRAEDLDRWLGGIGRVGVMKRGGCQGLYYTGVFRGGG